MFRVLSRHSTFAAAGQRRHAASAAGAAGASCFAASLLLLGGILLVERQQPATTAAAAEAETTTTAAETRAATITVRERAKVSNSDNFSSNFYDVVVVGSGVFGLSTAWHLSKLGRSVAVLDREVVGSPRVASSVNAGMLENCYSDFGSGAQDDDARSLLEDDDDDEDDDEYESEAERLEEILHGGTLAIYANLAQRHSIEFTRMGLLELIESEEQLKLARDEWELPLASRADVRGYKEGLDGGQTQAAAAARLPPWGSIVLGLDLLRDIEPLIAEVSTTDGSSSNKNTKTTLLGAVLYPNCATAHPAKVMRAMKEEAMKEGAVVLERVHVKSLKRIAHDCDCSCDCGGTSSCNDDTDDENDADNAKNGGTSGSSDLCCCCARWTVNGRLIDNYLSDPDDGEPVSISARHVVVAGGGLTDSVVRTAFWNRDNDDGDKVDDNVDDDDEEEEKDGDVLVPVIPVVGQMFRTVPEDGGKRRLRHLISSSESTTYWYTKDATHPPQVTHERIASGDDDSDSDSDSNSGVFGPRLTRHLYGKQTREGAYLFGGDRRVHPPMSLEGLHPLPRIVEDMHDSCHEHAAEAIPAVGRLPVAHRWGGVMSFSPDGLPIAGRVAAEMPGAYKAHGDDLWVATGLGGCGFMRGAMAGLLLAEVIGEGPRALRAEEILAPADPARFRSTASY